MTTTTTTTLGFINKLINLDSAIRLGKYEVVRAEAIEKLVDAQPTRSAKPLDRKEAGNLLFLSAMFHQSHAWRDSENEDERDAWSVHEKNLARTRTCLQYGAPCANLLELISQDLDFLTATVIASVDDHTLLPQLNNHTERLSEFLSEAECAVESFHA